MSDYDRLKNEAKKLLAKEYQVGIMLGAGVSAAVFKVKHKNQKGHKALRILFGNKLDYNAAVQEMTMQNKLADLNLAPRAYLVLRNELCVATLMDLVDGTLSKLLDNLHDLPNRRRRISNEFFHWFVKKCLVKLCEAKFVHNDLHSDNIGYVKNGKKYKFYLLDFQAAEIAGCDMHTDAATLYQSLRDFASYDDDLVLKLKKLVRSTKLSEMQHKITSL